MSKRPALHLFEGYGIELEYMLVSSGSLDVLPISDMVLRCAAGRYVNEFVNGNAGWSNEFVLHVMEIRNNDPAPSLSGLSRTFQEQVIQVNRLLGQWGGRLMPTGMHPWMDPARETRFWNHGYRKIYKTYDRIFNCKTHGWANIQSIQLNLPFNGDEELGRLHAAVRLLLPLVPALAASSPLVEGKVTRNIDNRLFFYRRNQLLVPSISGDIIPEPIFTRAEYEKRILKTMYKDISRYDTDAVLQHEWLNSRGAVPRFERNAIEVRLADIQECPMADVAVSQAMAAVLKSLVNNRWSSLQEQAAWPVGPLVSILDKTIRSGEAAIIRDGRYLKTFGYPEKQATAADLWRHLIEESPDNIGPDSGHMNALKLIVDKGTLSRRIRNSVGENPSSASLHEIYGELCDCLAEGRLFEG